MSSTAGSLGYKSPRHKLIRFFEKSRDQWKRKAGEAKQALKLLKNRIRFLETSRARWKTKANALAEELATLRAKERALEAELGALKKSLLS